MQHLISPKLNSNLFFYRIFVLSRPLPVNNASYRHSDLNGQLSRAVTTVIPQNPFNQMDNRSTTANASLDSRSHVLIQDLPRNVSSPSKDNKNKDEKIDNTQTTN